MEGQRAKSRTVAAFTRIGDAYKSLSASGFKPEFTGYDLLTGESQAVLLVAQDPLYAPLALRGARDGATETFDAAMRLYVTGDYAGALPGLRKAAGTKPDEVQYVFFLAVCQLLTGDASGAAVGLRQTIALGESPFSRGGAHPSREGLPPAAPDSRRP